MLSDGCANFVRPSDITGGYVNVDKTAHHYELAKLGADVLYYLPRPRRCREKRYADAYSSDGRRVVYVGVNYDPASRTVDAVRTEIAVG